jgi:hypothetical protein
MSFKNLKAFKLSSEWGIAEKAKEKETDDAGGKNK